MRAAAIEAHPYCAECGSTYDLTGHHLRYPALSPADIAILCRSCNAREGIKRHHGILPTR